jgi:thiol-disulfide isomerase/thioredoxin
MTDTPTTEVAADPPAPGQGSGRTPRKQLPVGPVGLLIITAIALGAAFLAARLVIDNATRSDAPDIQDVLDESAQTPLVRNTDQRAEIDGPAPNVRLEYLDGGTQDLSEVAGVGTPVVLNFWASTCAPCIKEMPAMQEVSETFGDAVTFVGIDVSDTVEEGKKMVARTGVKYRNARDPQADIAAVYGALSLPRTVLIGGDGTVLAAHNGELTAADLTAMLNEHGITAA